IALSDRDLPLLQTADDAVAAIGCFSRYGSLRPDLYLQELRGDHHPHNQNREVILRQLGDVASDPAHGSVLRVACPVFVRDYLRWPRPRVQIARDYRRVCYPNGSAPVHSTRSYIDYAHHGALPPARLEGAPKHVTAAPIAITAVSPLNAIIN